MTQATAPHSQTYPPVLDTAGLGKAMAKLSPQQRAWVQSYVDTGGKSATASAGAAGYAPGNYDAQKVQGWKLKHNPDVLAAIRELAEKRVSANAAYAMDVLVEIAQDPTHKDRFRAATEIANRSGMIVAQKVEHTHEVGVTGLAMVDRIKLLAKSLGMDPSHLLGRAYTDAEFVEVKALPAPAEPAMSAVGLEDLL